MGLKNDILKTQLLQLLIFFLRTISKPLRYSSLVTDIFHLFGFT